MSNEGIEWFKEEVSDDLDGCFQGDARDGRRVDRSVDIRLPQDLFASAAEGAGANRRTTESENALLRAVRMGRKTSSTFAGDLAAVPFPDVVVMLECSRKSGTLSVSGGTAIAQLVFERGDLVHTSFGDLVGPPAFYALMTEQAGQFEFLPGGAPLPVEERTIDLSVTGLLMEGSRLFDEATNKDGTSSWGSRMPKQRVPSARKAAPPPAPPALLSVSAAETLGDVALWIGQSSTLGQARQWYAEDLALALATPEADRVHIVVVTELSEGLPQIFPLSDAASLADLQTSIDPDRGIFGVTFDHRRQVGVDVILADIWNLGRLKDAITRVPAVAVVMAPRGSLAEVGAATKVELELLIERLRPPAILTVSQSGVERQMQGMFGATSHGLRALTWNEEESGVDLRLVISEALRLYDHVRRSPALTR